MTPPSTTQLAIIGGGPGGYAAAFLAADLGLAVTLIELEANPGGVCLLRGCIPSKALLHIAKLLTESSAAEAWGIRFEKPVIDLEKMRSWKNGVVAKMTGGLGDLVKRRAITYIQGRANFLDSHTLRIVTESGEEQALAFEHAIIATGSRPSTLPGIEIDSPRVMNSTQALEIRDIPKSLLIVGAGYIGMELGTVYAALGSKVDIVEMAPSLLPGADPDLAAVLITSVLERFRVMTETSVVGIKDEKSGVRVSFKGPTGEKGEGVYDKVLVAIGRKPNSSGLGLDTTQVQTDSKGFIIVDAQRRTSDPHIFAVGDVAGEPMLAHKASHEGRIAAETIAGHKVSFEPRAIPAVVFTDPEIAWCGLTEAEAEKEGIAVKVSRFPWGASGRAATLDRPEGVTKLVIDAETERVLGVGIAGSGAGELISEGVLAIEMGALASDIKFSIHPHPTLSETVMESAEMFFGSSTHVFRPKE